MPEDQRPLNDAQRKTAAELPWYKQWLIKTCEHPGIGNKVAADNPDHDEYVYCVRCPWRSDEDPAHADYQRKAAS